MAIGNIPKTFLELPWIAQTGPDSPMLIAEAVLGQGDPTKVMENYGKKLEKGPEIPMEPELLNWEDMLNENPDALNSIIDFLQTGEQPPNLSDEEVAALLEIPNIYSIADVPDPETIQEADKWYEGVLNAGSRFRSFTPQMVEAATAEQIAKGNTDDDGMVDKILGGLGDFAKGVGGWVAPRHKDDWADSILGIKRSALEGFEMPDIDLNLPGMAPSPLDFGGYGPEDAPSYSETLYNDMVSEKIREDLRSSIEDKGREGSDKNTGRPAGTAILEDLIQSPQVVREVGLDAYVSFVGANSDIFDDDVLKEIRKAFTQYAYSDSAIEYDPSMHHMAQTENEMFMQRTPTPPARILGPEPVDDPMFKELYHGVPFTADQDVPAPPALPDWTDEYSDELKEAMESHLKTDTTPYSDFANDYTSKLDPQTVTNLWGQANTEQEMFDREVAKLPGGARYHLNNSPGGSRQLWQDADTLYWLYNSDPTQYSRMVDMADQGAASHYQQWMADYVNKGPKQFMEDLPDLDDKIRRLVDNLKLFEGFSAGRSDYAASEAEFIETNQDRAGEYTSHVSLFHPAMSNNNKLSNLLQFLQTRNLGGLNASYNMRQGMQGMYDLQVAQNRTPAEIAEMFANAYGYSIGGTR